MADYIYKSKDDKDLMLTYLPPTNVVYEKSPLYFIIPGGGWYTETRQSMIEFSHISIEHLRGLGFSVVSIDYRVTSDGKTNMYDILEDCFDALNYVAENAEELNIDKDNIILSGHSAGAHLALMLGFCNSKMFSKNEKNYTIKGIAAMSAPSVLYDTATHHLQLNCDNVFRNCDINSAEKETSPIEYVTKDCPPTLLVAGTSDYLVFSYSSEILYKKLCEAGVETKLLLSVCGGHCFEQVHPGIEPSLTMGEIQLEIVTFSVNNIYL